MGMSDGSAAPNDRYLEQLRELLQQGLQIKKKGRTIVCPQPELEWPYDESDRRPPQTYVEYEDDAIGSWKVSVYVMVDSLVPRQHHLWDVANKLKDYGPASFLPEGISLIKGMLSNVEKGFLVPLDGRGSERSGGEKIIPPGHQNIHHYHAPVAQGNHASIATATNSPGATVTAASGSASIQQRIRVCIEQASKHDPGVASAIQKVADAIATSAKLAEDQRQTEAQELILAIAEECSKPPTERQPAARSKGLAAGMREVLSLAADVLQVWTVCWPSIAPALGVIA